MGKIISNYFIMNNIINTSSNEWLGGGGVAWVCNESKGGRYVQEVGNH
jgi:hypothetical protein